MVFQRWNVLLLTIPNSLLHKINKNWCSYKIVQNNPLSLSLHNYNEILIFQGRDTGYEIVVPRKVGSDGKFVSHQIPHHFKRSLYAPADRGGGGRVEDDAVHYRLKIGQKDYHLELRPNPSLVAPGELKIKITTCVFVLISVEKKKKIFFFFLIHFQFSLPLEISISKKFSKSDRIRTKEWTFDFTQALLSRNIGGLQKAGATIICWRMRSWRGCATRSVTISVASTVIRGTAPCPLVTAWLVQLFFNRPVVWNLETNNQINK